MGQAFESFFSVVVPDLVQEAAAYYIHEGVEIIETGVEIIEDAASGFYNYVLGKVHNACYKFLLNIFHLAVSQIPNINCSTAGSLLTN